MVVCELDSEISGEILGLKLPNWQSLLFHRVLPSCGGLIIYLIIICFDISIIIQNFQDGDKVLGAFCCMLLAFPALLSLLFTLATAPPGLQTEKSDLKISFNDKDIKWILEEIVRALFFPIAAIGRYCYLIFWRIEAVYASRDRDEARTQEALARARASSSMELYLFLHTFLHCAPLAVINILDMMAHYSNPVFDKFSLQAVSLVAASLRMASTATMYRRFAREKIRGRKYPWSIINQDIQVEHINNENLTKTNKNEESEPIYEPVIKRQSSSISRKSLEYREHSDLIQFSPRNSERHFYDDDSISDISSNYLPTNRNELDSDEEYVRPISIIDRVAPRRSTAEYTIENVYIPPPPAMPAPRPGSFAVWAEKLVVNAESIPTWLSAPPRRKHWEVIQDEPDIPRRVPRSYIRGLEPQDATASVVHFLGWYAFFVARLLSIAAFINFFPFIAIIILMSHYQVMLLFLIVPQASTAKRGFYVFLAFIYLFCLMEFKTRFRHVRVWHIFWFLVCTVEIVLFISLWAFVDNNLHSWWRNYVFIVTIVSMLFSYILFLVYFLLLQPKETVVYINNMNRSCNN